MLPITGVHGGSPDSNAYRLFPPTNVSSMSELDAALDRLRHHEGVESLILLGRDGLVIQHVGEGINDEPIAARIPGAIAACDALGAAADRGNVATAVLELEAGVLIVTALSDDLLLAVVIHPGVGFSRLLRELRHERAHLIELL